MFFIFRIATISSAMVKMTMNSSYVLISIPPFRKTRNGYIAALSAAVISILYCHGAVMALWNRLMPFPAVLSERAQDCTG